jgi:hypothetical protein
MNINCIDNKITNANGVLQPIILRAIKDIYLNGNHQMTAGMVINQCILIDNNKPWGGRLPAICNTMRNSIDCGGIIIGEDRDFLGFTISFDGNGNNLEIKTPKETNPKIESKKKDNYNIILKKKEMTNPSNKKKDELSKLMEKLDWKKLKDKKTPKLLIIGCCNAKSQQPIGLANGNIVNYNFGAAIDESRADRNIYYNGLTVSYFTDKRRNGNIVNQEYFMNALDNNNRREALDVYGSNGSPFYNPAMKALYRLKIQNCNLHLLIVSGLYGIIRHDDYINDYHLGIKKGPNVWGNNISNAVSNYIGSLP